MNEILDLVIIGGGPIGLACGIEAEKVGLTYVIIEKGCLVNSIYNYPKNMTFFSSSEKLEIGGVPFISHNNKPVRSEALEYYRRVTTTWRLKINLYEKVESVVKGKKIFDVKTDRANYHSKQIIISTGFYDIPYLLNVEGENLPKVKHYYEEAHPYFGQKIVVIGAANSAVDVALETYRKGAEVTMVIREDKIRESVKYWVKPDLDNRIKEGSIKAYFSSEVRKITSKSVEIETPEGSISLPNDFVLAMTGYKPNFDFLKSIGIEIGTDTQQTPVHNADNMQTNIEGVYLAGVICGGLKTNKWFIENSIVHAEMIVEDIVRKSGR